MLEHELKQQLGLLGGEKSFICGAGGLAIIQDENDSNQDSDFSGDEDETKNTNNKNGQPANSNENDIIELMSLNQNQDLNGDGLPGTSFMSQNLPDISTSDMPSEQTHASVVIPAKSEVEVEKM